MSNPTKQVPAEVAAPEGNEADRREVLVVAWLMARVHGSGFDAEVAQLGWVDDEV
jgi:hypothetical protein